MDTLTTEDSNEHATIFYLLKNGHTAIHVSTEDIMDTLLSTEDGNHTPGPGLISKRYLWYLMLTLLLFIHHILSEIVHN